MTQNRPARWLADVEQALAPGARVIIAAALASLMLVGIGSALAWRSYSDRVDREQELVADAAADAAATVSQFFSDRLAVLQAMSELPGVAQAEMDAIRAIVATTAGEGLSFSGGVGWVDSSGLLLSSSVADPGDLPIDLSDRVFVIRALESGLPSIGDVVMARLIAEMVAVIAVPTFSNGQVNGVFLGYVALDQFDLAIPSLVPHGLVTRVVDRGGSVILTSGLGTVPYVPENGALLQGPASTRGVGLMGQPDRMIGVALVPESGWTVVTEQDARILLAGSRGRFLGEVAVLILLSLITMGAAVVAAVRMDRSHQQMLEGARNLSSLETLSEKLSAAPAARDVADAVLEVFGSVFDAESVVVGLADSDGRLKAYTIADDLDSPHPDLPDELVSLDDHSMLVEAFESFDELLLMRSELESRYPDLVLPAPVTGAMTGRFVGRNARGCVCLFVHGQFPPKASEAELFATMVPLLGDAFGRAAAAESQRLAARAFQQALLPRDTIGLEVDLQRAVRYIAAVGDVGVGGDWYDLWMVDDERVGAVVGDVVGRGVEAAAAMGQLRSALRATTAASKAPGDALAQLDSLVGQISGSPSATVLLSVFDIEKRIFHLASAGHLPPLVATKGHIRVMYEVRGTPIGFLNQPMTRVTMTSELEPEDTLVFYTDGLVERRGESIDQGIERLQRALSEHRHLGVEALADQLVKSCLEPDNQDDVALLVLRLVDSDPASFTRSSSIEGFAAVLDEIRAWGTERFDDEAIAFLVDRLGEAYEVVLRCTAHDPVGDLVVEVSEAEPGPLRATLEFRRVAVESGTGRVNRMILRGWRYGELVPSGTRLELSVGGAPPST